jgi:hypothetical protein
VFGSALKGGLQVPVEEPIAVVEVNVQAVYRRAKSEARNALLIGRRDINRLSQLNSQLGDDDRAVAEDCITRLEALMAYLEEAP